MYHNNFKASHNQSEEKKNHIPTINSENNRVDKEPCVIKTLLMRSSVMEVTLNSLAGCYTSRYDTASHDITVCIYVYMSMSSVLFKKVLQISTTTALRLILGIEVRSNNSCL